MTGTEFLNLYDNYEVVLRICDWFEPDLNWFHFRSGLPGNFCYKERYHMTDQLMYIIKGTEIDHLICTNVSLVKNPWYQLYPSDIKLLKDIIFKYEIENL